MEGDPEHTGVWFGEVAGLIHAIEPAGLIVERMAHDAASRLRTPMSQFASRLPDQDTDSAA